MELYASFSNETSHPSPFSNVGEFCHNRIWFYTALFFCERRNLVTASREAAAAADIRFSAIEIARGDNALAARRAIGTHSTPSILSRSSKGAFSQAFEGSAGFRTLACKVRKAGSMKIATENSHETVCAIRENVSATSTRTEKTVHLNALNRFGPLVGRILIALIYLLSGLGKITGFESTVSEIARKNLPLPEFAAIGAIIVELGGGTMLVIGWKARWAAAALFVFTALAGLIFHNFWAAPAAEAANQTTHFLKNVCIMGGLLFVAVHGSGPLSIERDTPVQAH